MISEPPTLRVEQLSVRYKTHAALSALTLEGHAGELIAIIGPNGAGKTTFIKALSGQVQHEGQIAIDGHVLKIGADRRHHIGLVPQDIGLYPHLTARENLMVMGQMMGVKTADLPRTVDWALDAVGLQSKGRERLTALSGGMKRRINVAAAIMHKPKVLIFDEPTAGVDLPARDVVHKLARALAGRGMLVLLITHELEQAETVSDKVLILNRGKALAFEPAHHLLARHFGPRREVIVRFTEPPDPEVQTVMDQFAFEDAQHATVFKTRTQEDGHEFSTAFSAAMQNFDDTIREITIRRPGLETLLHDLERGESFAPHPVSESDHVKLAL